MQPAWPTGAQALGATSLGAALLVCLLVLLTSRLPVAGAGTSGSTSGMARAGSASLPVRAADASQRAELGLARISLSGLAYDLTYDATRNALWFAEMSLGGPSTLYEYRLADDTLTEWPLPQAGYNEFVTRVRVAPDGSVWLNQLYSILRVDPRDGSIGKLQLAQTDPDAIASALSPDNRFPGTWPAAIAIEANGTVLVSRHNVTSLLEVTSGLAAGGRLELPTGVVGPSDIADVDGVVYWATPKRVGATTEAGAPEAVSGLGATRLTSSGHLVLALGTTSIQTLSPAAASAWPSTGGRPTTWPPPPPTAPTCGAATAPRSRSWTLAAR